ncbi:MarR family winged helix-turn-helix transcriptional regulator [Saccharomonospora cyanea]|uniref:Transcriptional regulator n=1 Tax=Saccharomonospora cyanea NA-134 TaxID=882082 RepID=H5XF51_9PSEU|nr:MarR family transcriptional regulator [Saccharomonospora cyanea]EHR61461.1 transcriptional regulator [Saccharomonospora cyanea NA-134]
MADAVAGVVEQWRKQRPDVDFEPIAVVGRLMRLSRLWDKAIKDFLTRHGVDPGEFDVLSTLRRAGEPYRLSAGEILGASLVTSGAITLRIDRMEAKGLVERVRDASDRRVVRVQLTPKGLATIDDLIPRHLANEADFLRALDQDDRERLADLLSALLTDYEHRT